MPCLDKEHHQRVQKAKFGMSKPLENGCAVSEEACAISAHFYIVMNAGHSCAVHKFLSALVLRTQGAYVSELFGVAKPTDGLRLAAAGSRPHAVTLSLFLFSLLCQYIMSVRVFVSIFTATRVIECGRVCRRGQRRACCHLVLKKLTLSSFLYSVRQ